MCYQGLTIPWLTVRWNTKWHPDDDGKTKPTNKMPRHNSKDKKETNIYIYKIAGDKANGKKTC